MLRLGHGIIVNEGLLSIIEAGRFGAAVSVPPFRCRRFGASEVDKMGHFGAKFFLLLNAILSKLILPQAKKKQKLSRSYKIYSNNSIF